jgi:opacity protein-like surface antigen
MTRVSSCVLIAILVAAAPSGAQAQDKKINVNLGGGYTATLSKAGDYLGDGYNVNFGVTINVTEAIGIQAEYSFTGLGQKQITLDVSPEPGAPGVPTDFFGDMNMQYGDFNLIVKPHTQGKARPYLVAGVGVYYRPIKVTTPAVGYVPPVCSPWWYYCYPGGFVPVDKIVGSRSSTDFGMDIGGGVDVALSDAASFYIEARYHYIWGPTYTDQSGAEQKANGQFFPITFGVRF